MVEQVLSNLDVYINVYKFNVVFYNASYKVVWMIVY